jgi:hypothetical protein
MKVMFSTETHGDALAMIQGEGPVEQRLADGIVTLMGTLIERSNNTMPPGVVIPAGAELLVAAGDYLKQSETEPITDEQIGEALALFAQQMLEHAGADPAQLQQMLQPQGLDATPAGAQGLVNNAPAPEDDAAPDDEAGETEEEEV